MTEKDRLVRAAQAWQDAIRERREELRKARRELEALRAKNTALAEEVSRRERENVLLEEKLAAVRRG